MNGKKKSGINLGNVFKKLKGIKIKKGRARIYLIILLVIIILVLSCLLKPVFYSSNIKRVRSWNVSENYDLGTAADDAMKHVKWKDKDGVVTLTGTDRKTKDKIVITFKVGDYMSFESMIRDSDPLEYFEWEEYMRSYKKN